MVGFLVGLSKLTRYGVSEFGFTFIYESLCSGEANGSTGLSVLEAADHVHFEGLSVGCAKAEGVSDTLDASRFGLAVEVLQEQLCFRQLQPEQEALLHVAG